MTFQEQVRERVRQAKVADLARERARIQELAEALARELAPVLAQELVKALAPSPGTP
jgi:hypothetical protein